MNRTKQLSIRIKLVLDLSDLSSLRYTDPLGGTNACFIPGWDNLGNETIIRAAKMAGCPTMRCQRIIDFVPSTATPASLSDVLLRLYDELFL